MITVRDILQRSAFSRARLIAGRDGQDRSVKWVHIGEIPNLSQFLQGGELVLSTGVGLGTPDLRKTFIMGLIQAEASGLVLELGSYFPSPPADMLEWADQHRFPIIAFPEAVRFLDLSYEINTLIISQHHQVLLELEALSLKIRQILLNTEGPAALLKAFTSAVGRPIWYHSRRIDHDDMSVGDWTILPQPRDTVVLHPTVEGGGDGWWVRQSIIVFDHPVADIYVENSGPELEERVYLALDRIAAALAQDFIRAETLDRTRRREEAVMLELLFFQEPLPSAVLKRFNSRYGLGGGGANRFRVGIAHPQLETILQHHGGTQSGDPQLLLLRESDRILVVLVGRPSWIDAALQHIADDVTSRMGNVGWSLTHDDGAALKEAMLQAHDAWVVAHLPSEPNVRRYDDLGLYRWILATDKAQLQTLLIDPELGAVLTGPRQQQAVLLETLEAVVANAASKSEAADKLGIHRQTLYSRLERIESLLGKDFLAPHRKTAIQAAILALRYTRLTLPENRP